MIGAAEAAYAALGAPFPGFDANRVEKRADFFGGNVKECFETGAARRDLGVGWQFAEDRLAPWGKVAVAGDATIEVDAGQEDVAAQVTQHDAYAATITVGDMFGE